jgi:hypothetical protein
VPDILSPLRDPRILARDAAKPSSCSLMELKRPLLVAGVAAVGGGVRVAVQAPDPDGRASRRCHHAGRVSRSERALELIGKRIAKEIPLSGTVDVNRLASPHGTFMLALSDTAAPFAQFAQGDLRNRSTRVYWDNAI